MINSKLEDTSILENKFKNDLVDVHAKNPIKGGECKGDPITKSQMINIPIMEDQSSEDRSLLPILKTKIVHNFYDPFDLEFHDPNKCHLSQRIGSIQLC